MKKPANCAELAGFIEFCGRGERIRTSGLYVPNVALYQAKLHPDILLLAWHHRAGNSGAPLQKLSR